MSRRATCNRISLAHFRKPARRKCVTRCVHKALLETRIAANFPPFYGRVLHRQAAQFADLAILQTRRESPLFPNPAECHLPSPVENRRAAQSRGHRGLSIHAYTLTKRARDFKPSFCATRYFPRRLRRITRSQRRRDVNRGSDDPTKSHPEKERSAAMFWPDMKIPGCLYSPTCGKITRSARRAIAACESALIGSSCNCSGVNIFE